MAFYLNVISVIYLIIIQELIACHEECGRKASGDFEYTDGVWTACLCTCRPGFTPRDEQRIEVGGLATCNPAPSFVVPQDPLPCKEAQEYCKNTYGTNLATIRTDDDRTAAQDALNDAGEESGYIGLYSDDIETKWQFRSEAECPSLSAYKCVDFWRTAPGGIENRPRCIGPTEDGDVCAHIHASDGLVDNDIPSNPIQPFLCDLPVSATTTSSPYYGWYWYSI